MAVCVHTVLYFACLVGVSSSLTVAGLYSSDSRQSLNRSLSSDGAVMLVAGMTSGHELCLAVEGGLVESVGADVSLIPCVAAVAAGDGRELFFMQPNGDLLTVVGKLCVAVVGEVAEGGRLSLRKCDTLPKDGRNVFNIQGNGQIRLAGEGQHCLSQRGTVAGLFDAALQAAASASSTADTVMHGANMAVDGKASYWASKLGDVRTPVEFTVNFGSIVKLESVEIAWEYPAKSFAIQISQDGSSWSSIYSTNVNFLNKTALPLGHLYASRARVVMLEPHPLYGIINGQSLYGITSVAFMASRLQTIVEDCATAGSSMDARDKYFLSYVGDYDPYASKALRGELPSLDAAKASLAATTSELSDALSHASSCTSKVLASSFTAISVHPAGFAEPSTAGGATATQATTLIDETARFDLDSADALVKATRILIIQARTILK